MLKLGEVDEVSFGMLKLGELGKVSFEMLKLSELGSWDLLLWTRLGEVRWVSIEQWALNIVMLNMSWVG